MQSPKSRSIKSFANLRPAHILAALIIASGSASSALAVEVQAAVPFGQAGTVKVRVPNALANAGLPMPTARMVAKYDSFTVFEIQADQLPENDAIELLTEENFILLNAVRIDTTTPNAKAEQKLRGEFAGKSMQLVQFAGPVQPQWIDSLNGTGVEIVTYIPANAYIVYGDATAISKLQNLAASTDVIQWNGEYRPEFKIHPDAMSLVTDPATASATDVLFEIQLVKDAVANQNTLGILAAARAGNVISEYEYMNYYNIVVALPPAMLTTIAALGDVVSIHHYVTPEKHDERQNQIIAGNTTGNGPSAPGYLTWITGKGFTQAQFDASNFSVDVTDSGIDNATTSPNHFGLYVGGVRPGTSRVTYNRLVGTPNGGSTLRGCDGHGTLNSHIVAGFNNLAGAPHTDAAGYHYGLGVCPWVRVGSSVIFDPSTYTNPNLPSLQSQAYNSGARISTNSWGAAVGGAYNASSQTYDGLVRDAQPAGSTVPAAGNQEMVIVFSAGNAGAGANTIGSPGTGKNILCVGAAENVHPFGGADGCGTTDGEADNMNDIVGFSSRGPCDDGRKKPDIQAPGTHVTGGVAQQAAPGANGLADPCYTSNGVCGGVASASFFPAGGQQWWTASSGTSHSCPAVAGGAALVRQFFINNGMSPASPAMTKAVLMNSTRYMTGVSANDTLPSNSQGMGEMHLGNTFDRTAATSVFRDQIGTDMFTASGQTRVFTGTIGDSSKPFRVSLAWTDAPGATAGNAYKNNLDLTVTVGANTYRGNVFTGANSVTGGVADVANNVESVFLPAGTTGAYTVTVTATNINSDGVPNVGTALDQDFGLVIYNNQTAPNNDACGSAIDVSAGGTFNGTLVNATNDGTASCGTSASNADVWYSYTNTSCTARLLSANTCGSNLAHGVDTVISFLNACGGTEIACNDDTNLCGSGLDSALSTLVAPGATVKIRVSKFGTRIVAPFILNVSSTSNDNCADAFTVAAGSHSFCNTGANTDGPLTCVPMTGDLWYRYTSPLTGKTTVTTCGTSIDSVVSVYPNVCPAAGELACNDDDFNVHCGSGFIRDAWTQFNSGAGTTYLIRVGGFNGQAGNGTLTIQTFCSADFNQDTTVDFFDYLDFVDSFSANDAAADFNGDTSIDFFDYLDFVDAFSAGC